jgi:AcrR family transcriptional regulator
MATIADEAGVGIGTRYRHYPTRPALLAALTLRSFKLVLQRARAAAMSDEPASAALAQFFEQTIAARNELILPLHGGPVIHDETIDALRTVAGRNGRG